jgi:hypothetical protein
MQGKLAENWLDIIRLYTFYSPLRKGKYRLFEFALRQVSELPKDKIVAATDGRKFNVNLQTGMFDTVFFSVNTKETLQMSSKKLSEMAMFVWILVQILVGSQPYFTNSVQKKFIRLNLCRVFLKS